MKKTTATTGLPAPQGRTVSGGPASRSAGTVHQGTSAPRTPMQGAPLAASKGPRLLRTFSPLPPGDPVALVGTSPQLNVIAADYDGTNYFVTYSQNFG